MLLAKKNMRCGHDIKSLHPISRVYYTLLSAYRIYCPYYLVWLISSTYVHNFPFEISCTSLKSCIYQKWGSKFTYFWFYSMVRFTWTWESPVQWSSFSKIPVNWADVPRYQIGTCSAKVPTCATNLLLSQISPFLPNAYDQSFVKCLWSQICFFVTFISILHETRLKWH